MSHRKETNDVLYVLVWVLMFFVSGFLAIVLAIFHVLGIALLVMVASVCAVVDKCVRVLVPSLRKRIRDRIAKNS
jgi:hypothetical protein